MVNKYTSKSLIILKLVDSSWDILIDVPISKKISQHGKYYMYGELIIDDTPLMIKFPWGKKIILVTNLIISKEI